MSALVSAPLSALDVCRQPMILKLFALGVALCTPHLLSPHLLAAPRAQPAWARASKPSQGAPRSIGTYAEGCLQGAEALKRESIGLRSVRRGRGRFYGHPTLIKALYALGERAAARGLKPLLVGDLSQPRGGLMSYGHKSHQLGLDADVWFGEGLQGASAVTGADERLNKRVWSERHEVALELAASLPEVERIFVHWRIKQHLCERYPEAPWTYKLRPWFGHDKHFHIRLFCPKDSPQCEPQAPLKEGEFGCDPKHLTWFSKREARARAKAPKPKLTSAQRAAKREAAQARRERSEARAAACAHLSPR